MTDLTRLLAAATVVAVLGLLLALWRSERRRDRADERRDAAIEQRDAAEHQARVATDLANQHWRELRAARAELERLQQPEEQWWASVPRDTPDSNAGGHAPQRGQFCAEHFSWLCQAGQGRCQRERPTELLPVLRSHLDTAVLPAVLDRRAR